MKVPYFLLELGDVTIFQPQNIKETNDIIDLDRMGSTYFVRSSAHPAEDGRTLWLNGKDKWMNHLSLLIPTNYMKEFEKIIDNHNRSLDV